MLWYYPRTYKGARLAFENLGRYIFFLDHFAVRVVELTPANENVSILHCPYA